MTDEFEDLEEGSKIIIYGGKHFDTKDELAEHYKISITHLNIEINNGYTSCDEYWQELERTLEEEEANEPVQHSSCGFRIVLTKDREGRIIIDNYPGSIKIPCICVNCGNGDIEYISEGHWKYVKNPNGDFWRFYDISSEREKKYYRENVYDLSWLHRA